MAVKSSVMLLYRRASQTLHLNLLAILLEFAVPKNASTTYDRADS